MSVWIAFGGTGTSAKDICGRDGTRCSAKRRPTLDPMCSCAQFRGLLEVRSAFRDRFQLGRHVGSTAMRLDKSEVRDWADGHSRDG